MSSEFMRATGFFTVFTFAFGLLIPVLPSFFEGLGFSETQLGWLYAILPLMMFLISPLAGSLSDKLGRKCILRSIVIVDLIAVLLYIFTNNAAIAVFARFFDALAIATAITVSIARVQDTLSDGTRGKYSGWVFSIQSVAKIVAPFLGGVLADYLFLKAPFILTFILLLPLLKLPRKHTDRQISVRDLRWFSQLKTFLGYRKLQGMAILGVAHHAAFPAFEFFLPLLVLDHFSLSYTYVGLAVFIHKFPTVLQFLFGSYSDRNPAGFVITGSIITALMTVALAFSPSYWVLLVLLFGRGIGNSIWNVSAWNLMSRIGTHHGVQGTIVGSYTSIAKLGAFVLSPISGVIVAQYGVLTLFGVIGILLLAGMASSAFFIFNEAD